MTGFVGAKKSLSGGKGRRGGKPFSGRIGLNTKSEKTAALACKSCPAKNNWAGKEFQEKEGGGKSVKILNGGKP